MPCFDPAPAWHYYRGGRPQFVPPPPQSAELFTYLDVPCGRCIGCRVRLARDWSIRCALEAQEHDYMSWATLTYDDKHLPRAGDRPTLDKQHLSGYLKRLRARVHPRTVRFFGCGEYGDQTQRPHYHVILYGLPPNERHIAGAWPFGYAHVESLTPARIAYTAGYAQKKLEKADPLDWSQVDPETGEVLTPERPFRHVSRRPGIGGAARRHASSWRDSAIFNGKPVPVPRFLHAAWRQIATSSDVDKLALYRAQTFVRQSIERREAGEKIALAKYGLDTQRRQLR